jgi:uncharacterized protein
VLVGQRSTTVDKADRTELVGTCDGATHFLQRASVGAFSMATGSVGKAAAVGELFKVGGSASSESSRKAATTDGSLDACRKSDPDSATPPAECRAPISVQLFPVAGAKPAKAEPKVEAKADPKDGPAPKPEESPCPSGFVFAGGICTKAAVSAHLCKPENAADCKEQCEKGSAESCYNYASDRSRPLAETRAYYKKACDGGSANGCGYYGFHEWRDEEEPSRMKAGIATAKKGCAMGGAQACTLFGLVAWGFGKEKGVQPDLPGAVHALDRSCALGDPEGCYFLHEHYLLGEGVAKDETKATSLLERACDGGYMSGCSTIAERLMKVAPPKRDSEKALRYLKKGCTTYASWCEPPVLLLVELGRAADAYALAKEACDRDDDGCEPLGDLLAAGTGTAKDMTKAKDAWERSCKHANPGACQKLEDLAAKKGPAKKKPAKKPGSKK